MDKKLHSQETTALLLPPNVDMENLTLGVFIVILATAIMMIALGTEIHLFEITTAFMGSGLGMYFARKGDEKKAQWSLFFLIWVCMVSYGLRSPTIMNVALSAQATLFVMSVVAFQHVKTNSRLISLTTLLGFIITIIFHRGYLTQNTEAITSTIVNIAILSVMIIVVNSVRQRVIKNVELLAEVNQRLTQEKWMRENIIHSLPGSVMITSFDTFATIRWCNDRTAEWLQTPADQLIGQSILDYYQSSDALNNIRKQLYTVGIVRNFTSTLIDASGGSHHLFGSVYVIDYEGQPALLCLMENVTVLEKAEQIVDRSNRMENVAVMSGKITHDFKNILTIIGMQIQLGKMKMDDTHQSYHYLQSAEKYVHEAAELMQQLRSYVRLGKIKQKPVAAQQFLQDVVNTIKDSKPEHIVFRPQITPSLPIINIDKSILNRVIMNLVFNAFEAIDDQEGEVYLHAKTTTVTEDDLIQRCEDQIKPDSYLCITIIDTGCGMSEATLNQIFDPFFTTKHTGSGLGLAAAPGIIESHGGTIWVDTAEGKGTTFTLLLPIVT